MSNLSTRDGTDCRRFYGLHGRRLAVKRHELYFEGLAVGVAMNNGPDVAANEVLAWFIACQHDAVVFENHRLDGYDGSL